jgi:hypothetical protein
MDHAIRIWDLRAPVVQDAIKRSYTWPEDLKALLKMRALGRRPATHPSGKSNKLSSSLSTPHPPTTGGGAATTSSITASMAASLGLRPLMAASLAPSTAIEMATHAHDNPNHTPIVRGELLQHILDSASVITGPDTPPLVLSTGAALFTTSIGSSEPLVPSTPSSVPPPATHIVVSSSVATTSVSTSTSSSQSASSLISSSVSSSTTTPSYYYGGPGRNLRKS